MVRAPLPVSSGPPLSLRGGNALDGYETPPPYDPDIDRPTPEYFEKYWWGVAHLDAASWRYYLPLLSEYALQKIATKGSPAVEALLLSLRPPDREPPRLGSLSDEQKAAVISLLDRLAFDAESVWQSEAMTALEEYWAPGALYRDSPEPERRARDSSQRR